MLRVVADERTGAELGLSLDGLVAEGARRMAAALEAEVDAYVSGLVDEVDENGKRLVVRNGHTAAHEIVTGAGPVEVVAPRVNDRRVDEATGERRRFRSSIIPPWARKSPKVAEVLPLMYLHAAPRGALTYPLLSREGMEETSLGPVVYLASKEKGDSSMPLNPALVPRRMGRGVGGPA